MPLMFFLTWLGFMKPPGKKAAGLEVWATHSLRSVTFPGLCARDGAWPQAERGSPVALSPSWGVALCVCFWSVELPMAVHIRISLTSNKGSRTPSAPVAPVSMITTTYLGSLLKKHCILRFTKWHIDMDIGSVSFVRFSRD